jgi:hypothetical protein
VKTTNIELAQRLSSITGRPIEDFYDLPTQPEIIINDLEVVSESFLPPTPEPIKHSNNLISLAKTYDAEVSNNSKLVKNKIVMSRREFLKLHKTMTQEELIASPLTYVMFRSEDQSEPNFIRFCESFR